ncbi:MAG: hypothetical protein HN712_30385 [Gemmatimonadetes bacterium]|nr:hypothetical protein [Gemmatimonadota bacterium]MBT7864653.1 hypothetical protein [Gemmatimonadota bacterium]
MLWGYLFVLLACSHDASRSNPVDPELTPGVALSATMDSTGAATLRWTAYAGDRPFATYQVLRRAVESARQETLAIFTSVDSTVFVDSTLQPATSYEYLLHVASDGGLFAPSNPATVSGYGVAAVPLLPILQSPMDGALQLRWTQYRDPGFESYEVIRRQVGSDLHTTVHRTTVATDTVFADSNALHRIPYSYTVSVAAAGRELISPARESTLQLPAVRIEDTQISSSTATASLSWDPYEGPHFLRYEVRRRTKAVVSQIMSQSEDLTTTNFEDKGLRGDTHYIYQVVVITTRGEEVASSESSDAFHELLGSWTWTGSGRPIMDLYGEDQGATALVRHVDPVWGSRVSLLRLSQDLSLESQDLVLRFPDNGIKVPGGRAGMASAVTATGVRYTAYFAQDPGANFANGALLASVGPAPALPATRLALDPPGLELSTSVSGVLELRGGSFTDVVVSVDGELLPDQPFTDFAEGVFQSSSVGRWDIIGGAHFKDGWLIQSTSRNRAARVALPAGDITVQSLVGPWPATRVQIELSEGTVFALSFDFARQAATLTGQWTATDGQVQRDTVEATMPLMMAMPTQITLSVSDHAAEASITPVGPLAGRSVWTTLATAEDVVLFTTDHESHTILEDGTLVAGTALSSRPSETRTWPGSQGTLIGVCLPEEHRLLLGELVPGTGVDWVTFLSKSLGPNVGRPGSLGNPTDFYFSPISMDTGPDGRIYVLDAGNSRIVSYDRNRRYISDWGSHGSAPGLFNFGPGSETAGGGGPDFAGSIAVDGDGFIYVADELNGRIQKFSP